MKNSRVIPEEPEEFNAYHFLNEQITFELSAKQEEYNRLREALETVIKQAEAFQRLQLDATEAAKTQLNKLAQ
jgi:hypothetical protein